MKKTEIIIIGGGLAGLTAAIHLASFHYNVIVFEKNKYPKHKVCGEYLSQEIIPYLKEIGVNLEELKPAKLTSLFYTTPNSKEVRTHLPMGGLGISRYALDNFLYNKALEKGVNFIFEEVKEVTFSNNLFQVTHNPKNSLVADFVLGAFGKRSVLDKNLNRSFIQKKSGWLAVKEHYKNDQFQPNVVALHNFKGGYCGISKTETDSLNVCYLTTYSAFKKYKNPEEFKRKVLFENRHLKEFFSQSQPLFKKKLSIAQISFHQKDIVSNHILMLGDAAALIHPLCGNGMAMAVHSAKLVAECILKNYKEKPYNRNKIEQEYQFLWESSFSKRLKTGRILQKILMTPPLAELSHKFIRIFPNILPRLIAKTHGPTL